ncbi:Tryptophan--tRNA ligase, mitochondrial [Coemansia sp. RSA 989]|nr:tryptophanyl-tRNA synthetase [Coemansia mojavensis]KAJ1753475.1 Tryptophan--tRNA ligase, mitochondrial [Coemansia sp. RSA 1821]KAJ1867066.1 Tryptophan--tRNA ligase, mitochondrial [Coemansia sp. RSA 989]KAJ1875292.1 Tryptophan--tRNA ligase, mitochondrial [Coemansia sp. RSA 990]KAJ2627106.1 Tryptophan--tRNA ligase, mitochondrial [Coemansia sp. RSA 1290]KAJ2651653.1 Tryptophan--tRNA ligase, mitochondrial [Coemansia sp. RSA 1250]KAJ2676628.1 Tryptophan--tRNA ligase, mitochondrial [Coemansia sp
MASKLVRVFSGIQPTGVPQLGNYLGSIKNWVGMQHQQLDPSQTQPHDQLISIVDLHALTVPRDPAQLRKDTMEMAASLIACGIDPDRCTLFRQSAVPGHSQLYWALGCITPMGWLNRMTQWKSKLQDTTAINAIATQGLLTGLFTYPVLMAADILLYRATHIPVGEDQVQHLEFTRDLVEHFHKQFKTTMFPMPRVLLTKSKRVMSLKDPLRKMSKSDINEQSRITLADSDDSIMRKIRKAQTDSLPGLSFDPEARPGVSNLLTIYAALNNIGVDQAVSQMQGHSMLQFKEAVADTVIRTVAPIREQTQKLVADKGHIESILRTNESKARSIAEQNWNDVAKCIGLS